MSRLLAMKTLLRYLLIPLIGLVLGVSLKHFEPTESTHPTTVIVLRHAEADTSDRSNRDPNLSEAGTERAEALAKLLSEAGVTHLFCSEYNRTHDTLLPLAVATERELVKVSARTPDEQIKLLRALPPGSVAVVAGHSNTAPGLVEALGVTPLGIERHAEHGLLLDHDEYNRLFVVTLSPSTEVSTSLIELRYGN